jgi:hypothetical protein
VKHAVKREEKHEERRRTVRILQSILGEAESTDEELADKGLEDLDAIIEALRKQIGARPSS